MTLQAGCQWAVVALWTRALYTQDIVFSRGRCTVVLGVYVLSVVSF